MTAQNKTIIRIAIVIAMILMIPFLAMRFTDEVNWKTGDFIVMGILLFCSGFAYQMFSIKIKSTKYRITFAVAIGALLLLIWAELAVGIFGTPFAGS